MLLVRVAERPRERRPGFTGLPRWDPVGGLTVDWVPDADWIPIDPRVVRRKADGLVRLTFTSHLRVVRCGDGRAVREVTGVTFRPQGEVEEFGVEDPRITPLDGRFYFTYVAVSRHGPATALASTTDFRTFERHGVDLLPREQGRGPVPGDDRRGVRGAAPPGMRDTVHPAGDVGRAVAGPDPLGRARAACRSRAASGNPAASGPVRRRSASPTAGWRSTTGTASRPGRARSGRTTAGRVLLDADDPARVLRQSPEPFFTPEADFEVAGFVPERRLPDRGGAGRGRAARLLRGGRRGHGGGRVLAARAARHDDRRGLMASHAASSPPARRRAGRWRTCWRSRTWRRG